MGVAREVNVDVNKVCNKINFYRGILVETSTLRVSEIPLG